MTRALTILFCLLLCGCGSVPTGTPGTPSAGDTALALPQGGVQMVAMAAASNTVMNGCRVWKGRTICPKAAVTNFTALLQAGQVQTSSDLTNWRNEFWQPEPATNTFPIIQPMQFFRVTATGCVQPYWAATPGADGYMVYWGSTASYTNSVNVGAATNAMICGLPSGTMVSVAVTAYRNDRESTFSASRVLAVK